MYISKELHDAICLAGVRAIFLMLLVMGLAAAFPWIVRMARRIKRRVMLWVHYRRDMARIRRDGRRYRARIRRDARRYRLAMKVFDEPVRWRETE